MMWPEIVWRDDDALCEPLWPWDPEREEVPEWCPDPNATL